MNYTTLMTSYSYDREQLLLGIGIRPDAAASAENAPSDGLIICLC